ncbi:MAG: GldG family protein [candidate division NC10 bacterium]|nr:GldG family protein [candidate division NC10 bacterium]
MRQLLTRRGTRYGLNTALALMLFLAIVVVVEALAIRHNVRVDLTEGRRHSLSDQSIRLVRSLEKDVHAIAFYRTDEPGRAAAQDLLTQYAQVSPKFRFELVDPDRHPGMSRRYGIAAPTTVVLESGGKEEKFQGAEEEKITNALVKLLRTKRRVVYFLTGHGEAALDSAGRQGLSQVKQALSEVEYEVKPLLLLREREVPNDAAVLVIAGPQSELLPTELQLIEAYVKRGGNLLVLLDPFTAPGLTDLLKKYGIVMGKDIIVDRLSRVFGGDYLLPVVTQYEPHPITNEFTKDVVLATILPYARTVDAVAEPQKGITVQVLVRTSSESWAETDKAALDRGEAKFDEGQDRRGPLPVGALATIEVQSDVQGPTSEVPKTEKTLNPEPSTLNQKKGRIVAYGTSAFMQNNYVNLAGNRDLFLNSVGWLAEEEHLIAIRPRQAKFTPLVLTANQARLAFWGILVLPPLAMIGTWLVVFLRRRRSA